MLPQLISLDHFRSRVYRQRIALVLLLILLGLQGHKDAGHFASTAFIPPTKRNNDHDEATSLPHSTVPLLNFFNWLIHIAYEKVVPSKLQSSPKFDTLLGELGHASTQQPLPTFIAHQAFSLRTLLLPNIFPTLVQLHSLWLVRLVVGEIEGRLSAKGKRVSFTSAIATLLIMAAFVPVVLSSTTRTWLQMLAVSWSTRDSSVATASSHTAYIASIFPASLILLLETIPTLVGLAAIGLLLFPWAAPSQISVPSPSHAPTLLEMLPTWLRAPLQPSERARARHAAMTTSRIRRHGVFGAPHSLPSMTRLDHDVPASTILETESSSSHSSDVTSVARDADAPVSGPPRRSQDDDAVSADSVRTADSSYSIGSVLAPNRDRLVRLQNDLIDEMENAGKLDASTSRQARARVAAGSSDLMASEQGKIMRHSDQVVSLPTTYIASLTLMISSSMSLVLSYAAITLSLPNLAPTSLSAVVVLLALRSEIGTLARGWSLERRRIEGLEFVRRRWGCDASEHDVHSGEKGSQSLCAICLESIQWDSQEEDGVRLDCQHELHAPCLVPWLMSQAFCPVCHRALRPSTKKRSLRRPAAAAAAAPGTSTRTNS